MGSTVVKILLQSRPSPTEVVITKHFVVEFECRYFLTDFVRLLHHKVTLMLSEIDSLSLSLLRADEE